MEKLAKVRKNERVITKEIDEELKEMFQKMKFAKLEATKLHLQIHFTNAQEDWKSFHEAEYKCDLASMDFWMACRRKYNAWMTHELGIREGFALVEILNSDDDSDGDDPNIKILGPFKLPI